MDWTRLCRSHLVRYSMRYSAVIIYNIICEILESILRYLRKYSTIFEEVFCRYVFVCLQFPGSTHSWILEIILCNCPSPSNPLTFSSFWKIFSFRSITAHYLPETRRIFSRIQGFLEVVESQCGIITSFQSAHFFGLYCQPGEPASRGCMTVGDTHFYTNISKTPTEMEVALPLANEIDGIQC